MAQDWMKIRLDLREDPDVICIAGQLDLDNLVDHEEDLVVGKLNRFWAWANRELTDGNAPGVTPAWIDRYVCVTGFAEALREVDWLEVTEGGIVIPHFERHLSQGAKQRALTARRAASVRTKKRNAVSVTKSAPKEEKEKSIKKRPTVSKKSLEAAFETWWLSYRAERRKEKPDALKEWKLAVVRIQKATGKSKEEARAWLCERTTQFTASPAGQDDPAYLKYPHRWLKKECYNEDPATWEVFKLRDTGGSNEQTKRSGRFRGRAPDPAAEAARYRRPANRDGT